MARKKSTKLRGGVEIVEDSSRFYKLLGELGPAQIQVGMVDEEADKIHPNSTLTTGEIAMMHELGLGGMLERSWLRSWFDTNTDQCTRDLNAAMELVLQGHSRRSVYEMLGEQWVKSLQDNILAGRIRPPLAASTIASKGGETRPLVDTQTLVHAISYKLFLPQIKSIADSALRQALRSR